MGLPGISPWSLLLILVIILLLFGTKKLRNLGGDLGGAMKGFKKAMADDDEVKKVETEESPEASATETEKKESAESK